MHAHSIIAVGIAGLALAVASCKNVDCGTGTIQQNGTCVPADQTVSSAQCGPFTELTGNVCKPTFDPTTCDPATTTPDFDPTTGVTTCIGNGQTGGCGSPFACPAPSSGKQTICGQIFDLENSQPFQTANPVGAPCSATAASGPCAIEIRPFDAISFAQNPQTATPLASDPLYIDDCGRYRVTNITPPGGPFLALGIDDAVVALRGPTGVTNTIGIATLKAPDTTLKELEGFVVAKSTTDLWETSGGPSIANGIYVELFRDHKTGTGPQAGVQATKDGNPNTANDFYFTAGQAHRDTIDPTATVTGANGTALIQGASLADGLGQSGQGGIDATCQYQSFTGASLPGIVFVQIFRPIDATGMTCDL